MGGKMYKKDKDGIAPREAEFCRAVARGENQSAAYRRIWQAESAKAKSVHTASSRLMRRAEIRLRISQLQANMQAQFVNKTVSKAIEDKELVLSKLRAIINEEITVKSEVIRSLELLGKTQALFSDSLVTKEADSSSDDIAGQINAILQQINQDPATETEAVPDDGQIH